MTGEIWGETAGKTCYNICRMTMLIWLFITMVACGGSGSSAVGANGPAGKNAAIVSISPADGAEQVAVSSVISVTFKSDMDPASLNAETFQVSGPDGAISGAVNYETDTRTATFTPYAPLLPLASYSVSLSAGVKDKSGKSLRNSWYFKTAQDTLVRSSTESIPATLFNLNIVNWEWGAAWPTVPFACWRNFHSGCGKLEPEKGKWDFTQLDKDVTMAEQQHIETLLVLVSTPVWASARPQDGTKAEAANIEDWKNYIRTVAERYKGQVHFYELWNEPNVAQFYSGTVEKLVELNREAYRVLKKIDPSITVVSSSMSGDSNGFSFLDAYLKAGGGAYADIIGYHFYVTPNMPEAMLDKIKQVKAILAKYNISKPLWNTESGWRILNNDKNIIDQTWAGAPISDADAAAYVARAYILNWASGIDRFFWYAWGHRSMGLTEYDLKTLKTSAYAYAEIQSWTIGGRMTSCNQNSDGTWVVGVSLNNNRKRWIVWNPEHSVLFSVPKEWKIKQKMELLNSQVPSSAPLIVGSTPIRLDEAQ